MQFQKPVAKSELEKILLEQLEKDTPEKIKSNSLINLNNTGGFRITLKKEFLPIFDSNNEALGLLSWFENYQKEAIVSTAGIRGLQNPLYPNDTRYPINLFGVLLATMGKVLVANEKSGKKTKITACEVRYNSNQFVDLISRIQAAYGIETLVTDNYETIPIFLISFLVFVLDLYGGEYVTSSHAMCKKIATKDLNTQGSQYIPDESLMFLDKVKQILLEIENNGEYTINISAQDNPLINRKDLKYISNGIDLYVEYLRKGVATSINLDFIRKNSKKILIECVGGSIYKTLTPILKQLGIYDKFDFLHIDEDPFNHGVGKVLDENGKFFDWGCDTTIMKTDLKTMVIHVPVLESIDYKTMLIKYPKGTTLLITDPDADRLVTAYIDDSDNIENIKKLGLVYMSLEKGRILVMFTPNQSFLMTLDFQHKALKKADLWDKYDWFMLKTTASQRSWDEWAIKNKVPVINTPVGFKELADVMINIEKKLEENPGEEIVIKDVLGNSVNIGKNPRLLFAGEESGGVIFGPPEFVFSQNGRKAISMREKSAGEAIIITAALSSWLEQQGMTLLDYFQQVYDDNEIKSKFEIRIDYKYYNESESDIGKLLKDKENGMKTKDLSDAFFLSIALGYRDQLINLDQVIKILSEGFPQLNFADVKDIKFVNDGTFILFADKCLEVRPSGTDAMIKAYCYGPDQWECIKYAQDFTAYSGYRVPSHQQFIPEEFYAKVRDYAFEIATIFKREM